MNTNNNNAVKNIPESSVLTVVIGRSGETHRLICNNDLDTGIHYCEESNLFYYQPIGDLK